MTITETPTPRADGRGVRLDPAEAAFHVFAHARRAGWRPLIILGIVYLLIAGALYGLMLWSTVPMLGLQPGPDGAPPDMLPAVMTRFFAGFSVAMLFYLILYVAVDAALLRFLYGRRLRPGRGGTEARLLLIAILWTLLWIAAFLPAWVLIGVAIAAGSALVGVVGGLLLLGAFALCVYLSVRLAPAAALTVHDGRLRFPSAWRVSRGAVAALLGAFVIVWAIYFGVTIGVQMLGQPILVLVGGESLAPIFDPAASPEDIDPAMLVAAFSSPAVLAVVAVLMALILVGVFVFQAMLAGINVYRVKQVRAAGTPSAGPAVSAAEIRPLV